MPKYREKLLNEIGFVWSFQPIHDENWLANFKKAAALANHQLGNLNKTKTDAITAACDEVIDGKLHDQFPVDLIQGGAGTSTNM